MLKSTEIVERPEGQRYWVVRASGGEFVRHFRQAGLVAIGHIDKLTPSNNHGDLYYPDLAELRAAMERMLGSKDDPSAKYRTHSHFNQVKTFIGDISIGDLIVTIDEVNLMVGRVIGHPFVDKQPVRYIYDEKLNKYTEMSYLLRRLVQWGPLMSRTDLPTAMKRSISARQTVFNIDAYWTTLYHLLYPLFQYENRIYFSARIKQREAINSFSVSQIFRLLTELEAVTRSHEAILLNPDTDFEKLFAQFIQAGEFDLKTVAEFMSPGSIWGRLGFSDEAGRKIFIAALLYGAIFGIDVEGVKVGGVIDTDTRQKLVSYFLHRLEVNGAEDMKSRLNLDVPKHNTKPLEDGSNDALPDGRALAMLDKYERGDT